MFGFALLPYNFLGINTQYIDKKRYLRAKKNDDSHQNTIFASF